MRPRIAVTTQAALEGLWRYMKVQRNYADSIDAAGGIPLFLPQIPDPARAEEYLTGMDGLLLTGGQDISPLTYGEEPHVELGPVDRERDRWEIALYRAARRKGLPILGICRGIQLMAAAGGGTLYQDIPSQTESRIGHFPADMPMESLHHTINVKRDSLLHRITGTEALTVNSFHHQAVKRLEQPFVVTATSASDGIIEAIEDPEAAFVLGIQYHGEALGKIDPEYLKLFSSFIAAAERAAAAVSELSTARG